VTVRRVFFWVGPLVAAAVAWSAGSATVLEFPRFNATFRDMAPEIAPVTTAGFTVYLSSPVNSLTIRRHEIELQPLGGASHRFRGMVDFLGKADLVAEFAAAVPARIEDQVLLPTQQVVLEGEVEIVRVPEGYDITTRKLPEHAEIAMQSRLGNQLLSLCDVLTILTGGDCSGIAESFGRVRLPLPPVGETYRVRLDQLTADESRALDEYLGSVTAAGS
jgi:hypothetical protein